MVRIKVCGITQSADAQKAVRYGASALGFIFYKKSPRYIAPARAKKIIQELPPFVMPVGVFVNHNLGAMRDIIRHCGLTAVQLHGDEDHHFCHRLRRYQVKVIKVFGVDQDFDLEVIKPYKVDALMFDTKVDGIRGGTGQTFDYRRLLGLKDIQTPIIVSGGLNAQNVIEVVNQLKPYAVDVNSAVESAPGIKDPKKVKEFIDIVNYISGPNVKTHDLS